MVMSGIVKKRAFCGEKGFPSISDSDEYSSVVPLTQASHVRVCVGKDIDMMCKFEMEANYLNHPLFQCLLELSAEQEFGNSYDGALRITCNVDLLHYLLHPSAHYMELSDLISKFDTSSAIYN